MKRHRSVAFPELETALKEFFLCYQNKTILSDAVLIEKAKLLAEQLEIPQGTLQVSYFFFYIYLITAVNSNNGSILINYVI